MAGTLDHGCAFCQGQTASDANVQPPKKQKRAEARVSFCIIAIERDELGQLLLADVAGDFGGGNLGGHFGDELGRQRDNLLLIEALRFEVAVDRLRENLDGAGFSFTVIHMEQRSVSAQRVPDSE
jgi:hypothetical protein